MWQAPELREVSFAECVIATRRDDIGCTACTHGMIPCKGGGNIDCWRRCPDDQYLAMVVDSYGGCVVIVGTEESIDANVTSGGLRYIVPDLLLHEPIAWNDIPIVVARAFLEFDRWIDSRPNLMEAEANAVKLYRLRRLEQYQRSLDLTAIVET